MSRLPHLADLLRGPVLPDDHRHTYVRHLTYALLEAMAAGILANAPVMALKALDSPDWQMALQLSISSVGMFVVLYLGGHMALRRKMPFVLVPGFGYALSALLMAMTEQAIVFIVLLGIGTLFEVVTRPAVTAIIRCNYVATHRGAITGEIRRWCAVTFLSSSLFSAWLLDQAGALPMPMIRAQMVVAAVLSIIGLAVFRTIRVRQETNTDHQALAGAQGLRKPWRHFADAWRIVSTNPRFRRYLAWGFLYAFGALIYVSFVPVYLSKQLHYSYTSISLLTHILPSAIAFFLTGVIGRWIDRVNLWWAWSWIRLGWGLDPILLGATFLLLPLFGDSLAPLIAVLVVLARLSRGAVMGGSWILWWQLGINHFAPPGGDTTRYMGLVIFTNGICRLLAPLTGAWLLKTGSFAALFFLGGVLVLVSAVLCAAEHRRERAHPELGTMARFEDSCNQR